MPHVPVALQYFVLSHLSHLSSVVSEETSRLARVGVVSDCQKESLLLYNSQSY